MYHKFWTLIFLCFLHTCCKSFGTYVSHCSVASCLFHHHNSRFASDECSAWPGHHLQSSGLLKSSVIWDITPCSLLKVSRRFRGTCCLHLQGQRITQARNHHEAGSKQSLCSLTVVHLFWHSFGGHFAGTKELMNNFFHRSVRYFIVVTSSCIFINVLAKMQDSP
jgi:hypothetical protein